MENILQRSYKILQLKRKGNFKLDQIPLVK